MPHLATIGLQELLPVRRPSAAPRRARSPGNSAHELRRGLRDEREDGQARPWA